MVWTLDRAARRLLTFMVWTLDRDAVRFEKYVVPQTSRFAEGPLVPIPTWRLGANTATLLTVGAAPGPIETV